MFTNCQLLIQHISDAILMLNTDGYILYINPAVTAITGYTTDDLLNKPLQLLYNNKNDSIKIDYELTQAKKTGSFVSEGWRQRKDDSRYWGELSFSPVYDEQGNFIGFSCLLRDTSEKKKDELALRRNEERFRLMVESVRDYAIFLLDTTGHIVTWNEGAKRIKGYAPNEIIGRHFSTFYIAEDLEDKKPERELKIAQETGKYEEEGWRVKKNGSLFWASVVITALFNEQNELIGFSKVTRDLTERRENEESMRQSEERYRSLVEQIIDYGIFMMDEKGRIISWNEGAYRIKGYTAKEIIGKYFSIFYPEEDIIAGKPAHELKVAIKTGKYEEEGWRVKKDGTHFWASVLITAIYNTQGTLIGFSKVTRDLTERKEAEKALRESYDRFRLLAEELKKTNEELSYTNQELEQFTSIVSHDLQEPIRTIKSFLQLIEMKLNAGQTEGLNTYISKSINAASRMRELILNLLNYTQLSKGEIRVETVNVQELIQQVLQNLKSSIEASKAQITVDCEVETAVGDRVQLLQLIQNLMSNSLKFTDKESPQIKIRCVQEDGYTKFAISDNGIGIANSDQNKVFEIFRRLNTKKDYPGTGIGLAICKKIVERHSGRIWPESEPGQGTTFYFTINERKTER